MRNILIIFIVLLCLVSCRTTQNNQNNFGAVRITSLSANVNNMLRNNAPFAAYMTILEQERTRGVVDYDPEELRQRIFDHIRELYRVAEEESDFYIIENLILDLKLLLTMILTLLIILF